MLSSGKYLVATVRLAHVLSMHMASQTDLYLVKVTFRLARSLHSCGEGGVVSQHQQAALAVAVVSQH